MAEQLTPENTDRLENDAHEQSASEYSREYWGAVMEADLKGSSHVEELRNIAVDETLAEMAKAEYTGGKVPGSPRWQKLYATVKAVYAEQPR